jgi:hypothetical protein
VGGLGVVRAVADERGVGARREAEGGERAADRGGLDLLGGVELGADDRAQRR